MQELLERFSADVSDVCACLMGFKVHLDHFWRKKSIRPKANYSHLIFPSLGLNVKREYKRGVPRAEAMT